MRARLSLTFWKEGKTIATLGHVVQGGRGRYRIEYEAPPSARGRIVWVDGAEHWQQEPGQRHPSRTAVAPPTPETRQAAHQLVTRNYRIDLVSSRETSAGRPAYVLALRSRHPGKGRMRRWVDLKTFKTLREETYFADGALARVVSYARVSLPAAVNDSDFRPPSIPAGSRGMGHISRAQTPERLAQGAREAGMRVHGSLGFELQGVYGATISRRPATQLLYSDGLESLSIFAQGGVPPLQTAPRGWRSMRIGTVTVFHSTSAHTDTMVWNHSGRRYTLVSHLEPSAVASFLRAQLR